MDLITALFGFLSIFALLGVVKAMAWLGKATDWLVTLVTEHGLIFSLWLLGIILGTVLLLRLRKYLQKRAPPTVAHNPKLSKILRTWSCIFLCYFAFEAYMIFRSLHQIPHPDLDFQAWTFWDYFPGMLSLALQIMGAIALFRLNALALLFFIAASVIFILNILIIMAGSPIYLSRIATILLFFSIKHGLPLMVATYAWKKAILVR